MKSNKPLIVFLAVIALFIVAYLFIPKTYDIYSQALELAKNDQRIIDTLGDDITDHLFAYSRISRGYARIEVTISGRKDSGLLLIRGKKINNEWILTSVLFEHKPHSKRYAVFKS